MTTQRASSRTDVFDAQNDAADRLVRDIIASNLGRPVMARSHAGASAKVAAAVTR